MSSDVRRSMIDTSLKRERGIRRCVSSSILPWQSVLVLVISIPSAWGAPPVIPNSRDLLGTPESGARKVIGLKGSNCLACHGNATSKSDPELPPDLGSRGNDGWFLGDEILTWSKHDNHLESFSVLLNEQSKQIAKQLGIVDEAGESLVHRDRRCLSCHSSVPVEQMTLQGNLVQEETSSDPRYTIGVSCEACHGPAGQGASGSEGWGVAHTKRDFEQDGTGSWRTLSPQKKFEAYGYWNVHSTRTQTRICLSCHLGNAEQKKIITHEMFAAGHPPLPSFELSQFVHQMPRHWRRLDEKPQELRDEFLNNTKPQRDAGQFPVDYDPQGIAVTKASMIAALVTLAESMRLTADLLDHPDSSSPELANYACFGCHHELVRDGWRKSRRLLGTPGRLTVTPGRPTLHEWPFALASVVADTQPSESGNSALHAEMRGLVAALNSQPYGNATELASAARALAQAAELQAVSLNAKTVDVPYAQRLLTGIADYAASEREFLDYDTARQFVWAYERTKGQLDLLRSSKVSPVQWGSASPQELTGSNQILQGLESSLVLSLTANRIGGPAVEMQSGNKTFSRPQRAVDVAKSLARVSGYHPEATQKAFQELKRLQATEFDK
ncbi:MAG: hypothetical protein JSS49_05130 [Planctomycetes bacterium]|nr:hypothetical protein [Planctomycetota bacterium]